MYFIIILIITKKMEINNRNITEIKIAENIDNIKYKKDILFDIKQSLFQQLTTQSSRKLKNRNSEDNTYKNQKYKIYLNFKNCQESNSIYNGPIVNKEEKSKVKSKHKYKINQKNSEINLENKKIKNKRISIIKNDNDIMFYSSECQNKNKNLLNDSNSIGKNNKDNELKFNNYNNDSTYILSTQKSDNENEDENENDSDSYEILVSHVTLPFCHYHKYNMQLPKQYICNFKNCSCCGYFMKKKLEENNRYKNKRDYIYPVNKTENKKTKYGSVLDKFRKNKKRCTLTEESNQLGDFGLNTLKPNNTNLKIKKKNYIIENSDDENDINDSEKQNGKKYYYLNNNKYGSNYNLNDKNKIYGEINNNKDEKEKFCEKSHIYDNIKNGINNRKENDYYDKNIYNNKNYISEKEPEDSINEPSLVELPYEGNEDINLIRYKYLVKKGENKSKIHFSVLYYKRLNKSYNQIYSKDFKNNQSNFNMKGINKNKNIEFLRE